MLSQFGVSGTSINQFPLEENTTSSLSSTTDTSPTPTLCRRNMYDPAAYISLPSLREAANALDDTAKTHLYEDIRGLFLENKAYDKYGVSLLHKHFPIHEEARLVDCRNTSAAWKVGTEMTDVVAKYEGFIVPRSFRFFAGKPTPYEFSFSPQAPSYDEQFQVKAFDMLCRLGLQDVFGLRYLDEHDPNLSMEITEGNTNIMMPRGLVPESSLIEALWVFTPADNDRCHCREHCWPKTGGDHDKDHSCG